ncbi:MAG: DUF4129 domain-containing protein [Planctomycetota bacterium]|nr:DUF4129 domain-containing protein [Planctomycetota bacterium]
MAALKKTTIDYMVIAISPILVTCMVCSLALFLSAVFHPSPFESRINLVIIFYSVATVGIARISIEEGKDKAVLYAIPLALVTFIAFSIFSPADGPLFYLAPFVRIGIIAITWWSAHKLTWDSTVIFDHEDSSGQGLLQKVGLDSDTRDPSDRKPKDAATVNGGSWFERWQVNRKKPHTPGVWVIYYSLAAMPLFGLGQTFIQVGHQELRTFCFQLGCIYVGSGLGLLMTTSFLGLRRYLRHRDIEMPPAMANMWLTVGSIVIGILMVGALILPRPGNGPSLDFLTDTFDSDDYETSEHAIGNDGFESGPNGNQSSNENSERSSGEGEQSGESGQGDEQGNSEGEQSGESGQGDEQGNGGGEQSGESGQGDEQGNGEGNQQAQESESQPEQNSAQQSPQQSTSNSQILKNMGKFLSLLIWIVTGIALLYFLYRNRKSLLKAASEMWHGFWEWLSNLFSGTSNETVAVTTATFETAAERPQPFASFNNPFQGTLKMSPREVIHYSFQALEAWAYEKGIERREDQTPNEFTREVAYNAKTIGTNIEQLGKLYSQEAYAPNSVANSHLPELQAFWSVLLTTPPTPI